MHEKNIKQQTVKQLKKNFPHWKQLTKKEKKKLAREVLEEVFHQSAIIQHRSNSHFYVLCLNKVLVSDVFR